MNRDNVLEGAKLAFGQPVETRYDFSKADVIVSLDADFLYAGFPGNTRYIRDFAKRRNPDGGNMNRLYVIESTPSSTGAKADHRWPVRASGIEEIVRGPGWWTGINGAPDPLGLEKVIIDAAVHHGTSVIVPGDHLPPAVHVLAHAFNNRLGNVGKTVFYTDPVDANPSKNSSPT